MMGFPSGSAVKNRPAMQETQETWVRFLSWEDPLEEGMATHSSILAWRIPRTEEPGGLQFMESQRVRHDWATEHEGNLPTGGKQVVKENTQCPSPAQPENQHRRCLEWLWPIYFMEPEGKSVIIPKGTEWTACQKMVTGVNSGRRDSLVWKWRVKQRTKNCRKENGWSGRWGGWVSETDQHPGRCSHQ